MSSEQVRAVERAEKENKKAEAALEAMSELEAITRKRNLAVKYASVRKAAADSEQADIVLREARGNRRDADEAVVDVTNAAILIIAGAGADRLLPPALAEGGRSAPEIAGYLITGLEGIGAGDMVLKSLRSTRDHSIEAAKAETTAEEQQKDAKRKVVVAVSEFNKELEDTLAFIRLNTDAESTARQRLKQKRGKRAPKPAEPNAKTQPANQDPKTEQSA